MSKQTQQSSSISDRELYALGTALEKITDVRDIVITNAGSKVEIKTKGIESLKPVFESIGLVFESKSTSIYISQENTQTLIKHYQSETSQELGHSPSSFSDSTNNQHTNSSKDAVDDLTASNATSVMPANINSNSNGGNAITLDKKPNEDFFYSGNHVVKLWEQYLKVSDPAIKFYSRTEDRLYGFVSSLFNGLSQNKEVAIVTKQDNTSYQNKDGKTITLCGEINYTGADQATESSLSSSFYSHFSFSSHSSSSSSSSSSINVKIQGAIHEAIEQIKSYNSNAAHAIKITDHIVIFPYHAGPVHWNLGQIELRFNPDDSTLLEATINLYEPFGGQAYGYRDLTESINSLEAFSRVNITQQKTDEPPHIKQQYDSSSCGAITAENGKEFLKGHWHSDTPNLLKVPYPKGASKLRTTHIEEIHDDAFFLAQRDNIAHEAKGDKPIENQTELQRQLEIIISKPENDWIKEVIHLIQLTKDDVTNRTSLNLFKEFLIRLDPSDTTNTKISNSILKSNGAFREGAIDLITTVGLTTITYGHNANSHNTGAHEIQLPNTADQKSEQDSSIDELNKKIQEARASVQQVMLSKAAVDSATNITILKEIENIRYTPLIKQLAYKKDQEELKALAILLKDLGYLTKQIGELSSDLKYYTDSTVFYQYVITIIEEKIDPKHQDELYNKQIEELYRELDILKQQIISISKLAVAASSDSTITSVMTETTAVKTEAEENKKILADLRDDTGEIIKIIDDYHAQGKEASDTVEKQEYEDLCVNETRKLFKTITHSMQDFLAKLYRDSENEIGDPPCSYTVIGLGSMALQQITPYSDLEFAILTANEDYKQSLDQKVREYFKSLSHLVHFKMINLGETIIPTSKYGLDMSHLVHRAVNFDLGGKTPLGRIDKYKPYELIQTVERMLWYVHNKDDKASYIDKTLPYILEKACYVYGNQKLITDYQALVTEFLHSKINEDDPNSMLHCEVRAMKILKEGVVELDYIKPDKPETLVQGNIEKFRPDLGKDAGRLFDVKQEIYRLADRLIHDLGMYYGIEDDSAWDTIDQLERGGIIEAKAANHLRYAVTFATTLRLKTYLHNKAQQEDMSAFAAGGFGLKVSPAFHLDAEDLRETGALFRYFYTALPLYTLLREFCNRNYYLSREENKKFFQNNNFYTDDTLTKGVIFYRLAQSQEAITNFQKNMEYIRTNPKEIERAKLSSTLINLENVNFIDFDQLLFGVEEYSFVAEKNLANAYLLRNDYNKAYEILQLMIDKIDFNTLLRLAKRELLHDVSEVLNNTACCLMSQKSYREAHKLYEAAILFSDNCHLDIKINLAACYRRLNQLDQARELLEDVIKVADPITKFNALKHYTSLMSTIRNKQVSIDASINCINQMKDILKNHSSCFKAKYGDKYLLLTKLAPLSLQIGVITQKAQLAKKNNPSYNFSILQSELQELERDFNSISVEIEDVPEINKKLAGVYTNFSRCYSSIISGYVDDSKSGMSKIKKAQDYFNQAIKIPGCSQEKVINAANDLAKVYSNYALLHHKISPFGIKLLEKSLEIQKQYDVVTFGTLTNLGTEHHNLAEKYLFRQKGDKKSFNEALSNYTQAIPYFTQAINSSLTDSSKEDLAEILKSLAMSYEGIGYLKYDILSMQKAMLCYKAAKKFSATTEIIEYYECIQHKISSIKKLFNLVQDKLSKVHINKDDIIVGIAINTSALEAHALSFYCEELSVKGFTIENKKCVILVDRKDLKAFKQSIKQEIQQWNNIGNYKHGDVKVLQQQLHLIDKKSLHGTAKIQDIKPSKSAVIEESFVLDGDELVLGGLASKEYDGPFCLDKNLAI